MNGKGEIYRGKSMNTMHELIGKTVLNIQQEDDSYRDVNGRWIEQTKLIITTTDYKRFIVYTNGAYSVA